MATATQAPPRRRKVCILVIDDEARITEYVHEALRASDLTVVKKCRIVDDLDKIRHEIDIVFLDVYFEGCNLLGEWLPEIKSRWPYCRIILLTNSPTGRHRECFDRISKAELKDHPDILRERVIDALAAKRAVEPEVAISIRDLERLKAEFRSPIKPFEETRVPILTIRGQVEDPGHSGEEVEVLLEEVDSEDNVEFRQVFMQRQMFDNHPELLVSGAGFELVTCRVSSRIVTEVVAGHFTDCERAVITSWDSSVLDDLENLQEQQKRQECALRDEADRSKDDPER